eukprot:scaffold292529_cov31-Tisochrysis_lutea.AAC.2
MLAIRVKELQLVLESPPRAARAAATAARQCASICSASSKQLLRLTTARWCLTVCFEHEAGFAGRAEVP